MFRYGVLNSLRNYNKHYAFRNGEIGWKSDYYNK